MQINLAKKGITSIFIAVTFVVLVSVAFSVGIWSIAEAKQNAESNNRSGRFVFGTALGLQTDTPDSTAFALSFYGDYYLTREFSVGPLLQMGFTNDLYQLGLTAQTKYTFSIADFPELKPHIQSGIGFIHADLDRKGWKHEDDTSFLIPVGIGAEYKLRDSVLLDTTLLFNFTNLEVRNENFFLTWLIGLKFPF
jgi:hypothetical protein